VGRKSTTKGQINAEVARLVGESCRPSGMAKQPQPLLDEQNDPEGRRRGGRHERPERHSADAAGAQDAAQRLRPALDGPEQPDGSDLFEQRA
jgi:hypothetical protein